MFTVLKIMGLIFEQFSNLLTDEFFWIIVLVVIAVYRKNSDIEAKMLGSSYELHYNCLLYTSDAADDLLCVDLGGRSIIKKKKPL